MDASATPATPDRSAPTIVDLLDSDTLQSLQDAFARLIDAAVTIRDAAGRPITRPTAEPPYCALVQSTPSGRAACDASHGDAAARAGAIRTPMVCRCHAGLSQLAVPVTVDGRPLAVITVGDRPRSPLTEEGIAGLAAAHDLPMERLSAAAAALKPWSERDAEAAAAFTGRLAEAIAQLCFQAGQLRQRVDELAAIHDVSDLLAGRTKLQEVLDVSTRLLVETLGVRAASLRLLDEETGELRIASVANLSPTYLDKGPIHLANSVIDSAALEGRTVYVADMPNDPRTLYKEDARREGLVSALVTALSCRGRSIGVLRVYTDRPHRFTPFEESLLRALASLVAGAIVNARLRRDMQEAERLDRQVRLAADVQRRMIPRQAPESPRYRFGCVYEPSSELCGDFYDFIEHPGGDIGVAIADVVGKGVPASLMMASARSALRAYAQDARGPDAVLSALNRRVCEDTFVNEFVTAFYGVLSADGGRLTYCNAGHDPVLLLRDGNITELSDGGMLLGVDRGATYTRHEVALQAGDLLLFFTDGLVEARDFRDEAYGRERLCNSLWRHAGLPEHQLARQLLWDVRRFVGLGAGWDDITLVVVRVVGA